MDSLKRKKIKIDMRRWAKFKVILGMHVVVGSNKIAMTVIFEFKKTVSLTLKTFKFKSVVQ